VPKTPLIGESTIIQPLRLSATIIKPSLKQFFMALFLCFVIKVFSDAWIVYGVYKLSSLGNSLTKQASLFCAAANIKSLTKSAALGALSYRHCVRIHLYLFLRKKRPSAA
jgi:hypothetical protein